MVPVPYINENDRVWSSLTLEHTPELNNIERTRVRNPFTEEQKEKAKEFIEGWCWKKIRMKEAKEAAEAFCIENDTGKKSM